MGRFENERLMALGHITTSSLSEKPPPRPFRNVNMVPNHQDDVQFVPRLVLKDLGELMRLVTAVLSAKSRLSRHGHCAVGLLPLQTVRQKVELRHIKRVSRTRP